MHLQTEVGFIYFSVLVVITSWSYQVSDFHWVKSDNGEVMCGTSPPNKTLKAVISRVHCVSSCNHGCPSPPCQAINYWKSAQLCQQFYYRPCTYSVQQGCENYQVTTKVLEQTTSNRTLKFRYALLLNNMQLSFFLMRIQPAPFYVKHDIFHNLAFSQRIEI